MFRHVIIGIAAVTAAGALLAQDTDGSRPKTFFLQTGAPGAASGNLTFISAEMAFESKTVTGAPYSAEAVTETTQTLADGNRISQTTTGLVARDSEGRTRREQTMGAGLPGAQSDPLKMVFINDPVAQTSYVLQPDHTAQKMPLTKGPVALSLARSLAVGGGSGQIAGAATVTTSLPPLPSAAPSTSKETVEALGQQTIEGVPAEGKRTTSVIPAGTIGNEQDIKVVNETWYSNDLQTMISSTRSDPRMGTTTYRLTNIQRAEPSPDLFQVPSDYNVRDMPKPDTTVQFEYKTTK